MFQKLREGKNIKDIGPDADELLAQCGVVLSLVQVRGSVVDGCVDPSSVTILSSFSFASLVPDEATGSL